MKTAITELLQVALDTRAFRIKAEDSGFVIPSDVEAEQLALNALEESLTTLIDSRIAKILNTQP